MRLICPSCSAAYDIPDNAIPASGRKVRCQACGEMWHQDPAEPADTGTGGDEFGELLRSVLLDAPESPPARPAPAGKGVAANASGKRPLWAASGALAGVVTAVLLGGGILLARPALEPAMPSITPFYEWVFGRPADPLAGLAFDRMALAPDEGGVRLTGMLINLTSKEIILPALAVTWTDSAGKTVLALPLPLLESRIAGEAALPVDHLFAEIPQGAASLQVAFGPAASAAAH